jgi:hypothetical protein
MIGGEDLHEKIEDKLSSVIVDMTWCEVLWRWLQMVERADEEDLIAT